MKRGFGEEYRYYIRRETPDLWKRIEKKLEEESDEDKPDKEKEIVSGIVDTLREDKALRDREERRKFLLRRIRFLAAAAACLCLVGVGVRMMPVMLNRGVKQGARARPEANVRTESMPPETEETAQVTAPGPGAVRQTDDAKTETKGQASGMDMLTEGALEGGELPELDEWADAGSDAMEAAEDILWDEAPLAAAPVGYAASKSQAWARGSAWESFPYDGDYPDNREVYAPSEANGFSLVSVSPLSTFSADVDTASYANVRRMIENGYSLETINPNAVRPEEFINYFSYDSLKAPGEGEKFGVTMQMAACPWKEGHDLLMIGVRTEEIDLAETPPENLTFLLDVSGSMADEDKLPLLQRSFRQLVEQLDGDDTVSIVTYANDVKIVLDSVSGADKKTILAALDGLTAEGGTYGEGGIQKAYALAEQNYNPEGNNRILLATDGDLNIGISDPDELEKLITEKRNKGIFLSVLGFGSWGIRDDVMERLADCGNGNYSYIDSLLEARKVLVQELGAVFHTVAEDVKFQVEFNPQNVNAYRLIGYQNRMLADTDFADDTKDAGEIGAGHTVAVLYELIPSGARDAVSLKYQAAGENQTGNDADASQDYGKEWATVRIRYKEPGEDVSSEEEYVAGQNDFTTEPTDDLLFASMAAEFAMILQGDENKGTASLEGILEALNGMDLRGDEYKEEFKYLVRMLYKR